MYDLFAEIKMEIQPTHSCQTLQVFSQKATLLSGCVCITGGNNRSITFSGCTEGISIQRVVMISYYHTNLDGWFWLQGSAFVWVVDVGIYAGYMGSGKYVSVGIDTILDQDTEVLGHDTGPINQDGFVLSNLKIFSRSFKQVVSLEPIMRFTSFQIQNIKHNQLNAILSERTFFQKYFVL